jgi:hypothetical protein
MLKRCLCRTRLRDAYLLTGGIIATPHCTIKLIPAVRVRNLLYPSATGVCQNYILRPFATRICTSSFEDPVLEPRSYPHVLAGGRVAKSATTLIRYQPPFGPDPNFFSSVGLVSYIPNFVVEIVDCLP